ncbi:hypothetical protein BFW01_g10227 [Lasiodiplodia theobromae]|uniref:DUF6606 domain-containing protein n=1 Tax=Lasiodiplodia theobromae TaxID=45133 RepID=A0A8H7IM45_9PEZI|nr:hypothetical protein BFW01_g10227 [Lasiodiplodia theobromae]
MEKDLKNLKPGDAMIVFVRAQNSGLLLFREDAANVLVHAFEASAVSEDVMQSSDRLIWRFPGQTISFGSHLLEDRYFTDELATMLHQLSNEHVESSMPTTKKANSIVPEERETAHPRLVTEALIPMLCAWGGPCKGPEVIKHVRDDVNWDKSRLPWRRSPLWLVLRVSMQILLSHTFPEDQGRSQYKNFMAFFMARISANTFMLLRVVKLKSHACLSSTWKPDLDWNSRQMACLA